MSAERRDDVKPGVPRGSAETYAYGGARVLVELHEIQLRRFLAVWRAADEARVALPRTPDPNYTSRAALLAHVLGCAARYLIWICEQLELPRPAVQARPDPVSLPERADLYLEAVLRAWSTSLFSVTEEQACGPVYPSSWGTLYCIDAMLEHAVMHPIRHSRQLEDLLAAQG